MKATVTVKGSTEEMATLALCVHVARQVLAKWVGHAGEVGQRALREQVGAELDEMDGRKWLATQMAAVAEELPPVRLRGRGVQLGFGALGEGVVKPRERDVGEEAAGE